MDLKEKLINLIQEAVGGCARYWAGLIAEHLIGNGVVAPVRCKECKYCDCRECTHPKNTAHYYDAEGQKYDTYISVADDHFCAYGKRRDVA